MPVQVVLNKYFARLAADELEKPRSMRRQIPSFLELSKELGVSHMTIGRLFSEDYHTKRLNLEVVGGIIAAMRRRGFDMDLTDVIVYVEEEEMEEQREG